MNPTPTAAPAALAPPASPVTPITVGHLESAVGHSRSSPRRRIILPFHKSANDSLHRMFNALQLDTYIRPHRHLDPPKAESILVVRGGICYFTFDEEGVVTARHVLRANGEAFGIDTDAGVFHTFLALEPDTVLFEVKPGPYSASNDKDFAAWAPAEGHPEVAGYLRRLYELAAV
ncbi:MAG: WbuC family cupin fold metalloprotein [Gemmataceae bacterium]|nr:WbuC family cupin fold metalloprotein [Gemmataceae bacterium]